RHRDQLALIRRVGQDLLVARHARVEDELAGRLAGGAEGAATEHGAVGEREDRLGQNSASLTWRLNTPPPSPGGSTLRLPHLEAHPGCPSFAAMPVLSAGAAVGRSSWTRRPPTKTATARPVISQPSNGVFRLFDRKLRASTRHRRSGSTSVTSAAAPGARVPAVMPSTRAGPTVIRATSAGRSSTRSATRRSASGSAVSRPTMPFA